MSIKDDLKKVKKELTTDEQMLVSAFKLEKFYKKHKIKIFSIITIAVLAVGGTQIADLIEQNRLSSANEAYLTLLQDSKNREALSTLKEKNPMLFELYSYKMAVENRDKKELERLSNSKNYIVSDISGYHLSTMEERESTSQLYRDMATMNSANILIKSGRVDEAKNQLALIDENSPVYNISKILKHYTIKGK